MAKSAIATGALTLGTASIGSVGAQEMAEAAIFADNFYPGADFNVIAQLEASTTVDVLQIDDETVPEISQPDEWSGYIIRYDIGAASGITTFMFMRDGTMSEGDSGTVGEDASVLSSDLNLLSTSAGGNGTEEPTEEEPANETEEEPANETEEDPANETEEADNETGGDS